MLEFRSQRQHAAKYFSQRREIVVGNPPAELQQLIVENWRTIERADDVFGLNLGLAVVQLDNNTRHTALPEWNQHPAAHGGLYPVCDAIGERHVQRDGQGNVAEFRHSVARIDQSLTRGAEISERAFATTGRS